MKQYKLTSDEIKQISHCIAQRSLSNIGGLEISRATEKYLESYNAVREKLHFYNENATD